MTEGRVTAQDLEILELKMKEYVRQEMAKNIPAKKSLWDTLTVRDIVLLSPLIFGALVKFIEFVDMGINPILKEVVK